MTTEIKPKPYPCIESTEEFFYGEKLIRLWIDEVDVEDDYINTPITTSLLNFLDENKKAGPRDVAAFLSKNPRINAVQIKDASGVGKGIVIYFKDF